MILILLGTQKQKMNRLIDAIVNSNKAIETRILIQSSVDYQETHLLENTEMIGMVSQEVINKLLDEAEFVISHGGTGSIIGALQKNKKVLAVARDSKFGEHIDNHQFELVDAFTTENHVIKYDYGLCFDSNIDKLASFNPMYFNSNMENFIDRMIYTLDDYIIGGNGNE